MDRQLTKHFRLYHFKVSSSYPDIAEQIVVDELEAWKYYMLCSTILQPVRDFINNPVFITSGKRSDKLNKLIGGSKTSQHILSEASDLIVHETAMLPDMFEFIKDKLPNAFLLLILYLKKDYTPKFIHVSLPDITLIKRKKILIHYADDYYQWEDLWSSIQR